ncbi:MAG: energy transducer TonB, partial [Bacteroidota bacterium]|nr:energy transducer TonB [Bacteroidota bacterium]
TGTGTGSGSGTGSGTGPNTTINLPLPPVEKKAPPKESNIYYAAVTQMPEPIGGREGINSKVVTPSSAKENGISGIVYVKAYIDEFGAVRRAVLIKGIGSGCDEAALNAVRRTKFTPGKEKGQPVKVQMTLQVSVR